MDSLQDTLSRLISIFNPTSPNFPYVLRVAQCTAVAGSLYLANKALNILALNHWFVRRLGVPWDFLSGKEVAVVTGGSSGFGHLIVKGRFLGFGFGFSVGGYGLCRGLTKGVWFRSGAEDEGGGH